MTALKGTVLRDIGAIGRTIQYLFDARYRQLGLQKGQFIFLTRICEHPGINLNRLAELARVDKTTATKAVQKLESLGYIDKVTDAEDARARLLTASPKAREIYGIIIEEENRNLDVCLADFSAEEIELASALLGRMRANLDRSREAMAGPEGAEDRP